MKNVKAFFCLAVLMAMVYRADAYGAAYHKPELRIMVDGKVINAEVDVKDNTIYISARDVGKTLNKSVYWTKSKGLVVVDNRKMTSPDYYIKDGKAMVELNYMLKGIHCELEFYSDFNVLAIAIEDHIQSYDLYELLPDYTQYNDEDLYWLARIIHAEAKGEPYEAKLAVGSVILNRVDSLYYPNTIKEVVFDNSNGVQFTPTINGSIYEEPSFESWIAAYEVLEGRTNAGDAMFFINPRIAKSSWVSNNRQYAFTLTNHDFYY